MTAFKVGDRVKVDYQHEPTDILRGSVVTVIEVDDRDSVFPYRVKTDCGVTDWLEADGLSLVKAVDGKEQLDLYTVQFICEKLEHVLDEDGMTDSRAAALFIGYLAGLAVGLHGGNVD